MPAFSSLVTVVRRSPHAETASKWRRALREGWNLPRTQVAQALGVSPSTVGDWESGREPSGEIREKYAYFLDGARTKLQAHTQETEVATGEADLPAGDDVDEVGALPETRREAG
ncbi:helix-turn-helix domain-containing protein [Streptomyces sp. NPDC000851]